MSLSTAMRRLSLLLLFIFMLLHQANFALSATNAPTPRAAPKACKRGGDLNTVIGLPHVNRAIKALPANFGDMKPIVVVGTDCALNATPDSVCINPVLDDFMTQIQTGSHTSDVTLWPNYIDALAVWAAIGFVFAFFTLIGGFIFCCCRCCCKKCGGGRAIVNQDGQSLAPFWHIAGTYGLLVLFLIFMVAFALAGVVQGNQGLTRAQKAFVKSPNGVITLVKGLFVPVDNLVVGVIGQAAVGLLVRFFNFMDGVIDFDDLHHIIQVCLKAVINTVTDQTMFGKILIAIDQFKASIDTIPDSDIVGDIIAGFSNTTKVVKPLIDDLQLTLNDIQDGVANITVTTLQDNVDTLNVTFAELRPQFLDVKNMTLDYLSLQDQVELTHAALEKTLVEPYSSANFDAAQQSVADLLAASIAIPDEVDLANKLIDLNNTINQAVVDLNVLINSLNETQNALDAIPQVSIVNDTLNEIIEVLQNITFDGVDIAINSIGNLFDALPDPGLIFDAIDTITGVTVYIPCVLSINKILDRVNEKVFELPSGINFTSTIDEFNKTFDSTLDQIRDMRNYVKDLNNTFEDGKPNTTAFNDVSDRIRDSIDKAINHIRTLQDQLVEIDTSRKDGGQFNLAPLIEKAIAARDNIENSEAKVSVETINKVLAMNGTRQNLIVKTQALNDFYTNTFPGFKTTIENNPTKDYNCTTDTSVVCYDPDNGSAQTPTPLFAAHTSCATLGKGTCQYPYEPTEETLIALESFNSSLSDIPLKSGVVTGIDSAVEKIDAVDFANYNSFDDLQQLQTDLVDYLQNAGDTQKNLDEIFDLNLDDLKDNFDGVDDVLNNVKGNLDDYRQTVVDFNKTLLDQTKIFDNVFDYEGKFYDIVKTLPTRLNTISKDALNNTIRNGDGLYGAADKVIDVFSDMIDKFPVTNPLSSISSQLNIVRILDIAADRKGKLQEAGAINYILSVYGAATKAGIAGRRALNIIEKSASVFGSSAEIQAVDTLLSITRALQEKGNGGSQNGGSSGGQNGGSNGGQSSGLNVDLSNLLTADDIKAGKYKLPTFNGDYVNGEIVAYPNNALCLIDECLDNTIDVYNTRPIPNAQQIFGRSIPVSREQAMLLPFLAPFFVILIGFLVLCLPGCGCCLSCCSICNAFFYFLFVGALFFPMVIFTGDFCGHVESIGATNINQVEPMLCTKLPASDPNVSPYNPAGYCQAGIKTDFFSWDVELDAGEFFRSVTEGCTGLSIANSGDGKAQEPVAALWKSLKSKVTEIVDNQLNTLAQEQISKLGFPLKQPAIDVVLDTSDDLVSIVSTLADDLGTALSCGRISGAYLGFKDTICCDLIGSFYWWAASFYLMAFTLLCCGCPAGALANQKLRGHKCHHVAKKTARETTVIAKAKIQQGKVKAQHLRERVRNGSWAPVTAVPVAVADAEYGVGHAVAYEPHQQGQEMTSFVGKQDNPYDGKVHQE